MISRRALTAAWVLAAMLVPTAALADPTSADRETARTLMQQGRDLRDKGDLKEALKRFKGADEIMHVPTTALEVARTQVALGLLVEARDSIATIRHNQAKPGEPTPFRDARGKADELDASLSGRIPSLTITLKGTPDGEAPVISVDGAPIPAAAAGLSRMVDPGHHVVVAKSPHAEGQQEIDVRVGEQKAVEVTLAVTAEKAPAPAPPTDAAADTPAPTWRSHGPTVLTWAGIGLAGVGAVVGTVAGVLSMSKKATLQSQCNNDICGPSQYADYDTANTTANISTIAFIAAGVGAGVAVVTLLIGHEEVNVPASTPPSEGGLVVRPWIGVGIGGVSGRF
jgi:hypothetical protein